MALLTLGTESLVDGSAVTASTYMSTIWLDDTHAVTVYRNAGGKSTARIGTLTGDELVYGSAVSTPSANVSFQRVEMIDSTHFLLCDGSPGAGYATVGVVSNGDNITFGSTITYNSGLTYYIDTCRLSSTKFAVGYYNGGCRILTVSGNTVSAGGAVAISAVPLFISLTAVSDTSFVAAYRDAGEGNIGRSVVATVSGNSISYGSEYTFNSGATYFSSSALLDNSRFVLFYVDDGNNSYGTSIIGTVSGTSISYGSEYVCNSSTTTNPSVVSTGINDFIAFYVDNGNSDKGTYIYGTTSGNTVTYSDEYIFNDGSTSLTTADYSVSADSVSISFGDISDNSYIKAVPLLSSGSEPTEDFEYVGSGTVYASGQAVIVDPSTNLYTGSGTVHASGVEYNYGLSSEFGSTLTNLTSETCKVTRIDDTHFFTSSVYYDDIRVYEINYNITNLLDTITGGFNGDVYKIVQISQSKYYVHSSGGDGVVDQGAVLTLDADYNMTLGTKYDIGVSTEIFNDAECIVTNGTASSTNVLEVYTDGTNGNIYVRTIRLLSNNSIVVFSSSFVDSTIANSSGDYINNAYIKRLTFTDTINEDDFIIVYNKMWISGSYWVNVYHKTGHLNGSTITFLNSYGTQDNSSEYVRSLDVVDDNKYIISMYRSYVDIIFLYESGIASISELDNLESNVFERYGILSMFDGSFTGFYNGNDDYIKIISGGYDLTTDTLSIENEWRETDQGLDYRYTYPVTMYDGKALVVNYDSPINIKLNTYYYSPNILYIGSGSVYASGSAPVEIDYEITGSGTVQASGSADISIDKNYIGSGSVYASGSAPVEIDMDYIGSGSAYASGSAGVQVDMDYIGSGSVYTTGSAPVEIDYEITGSGTVQASGSAGVQVDRDYIGSGTVQASGSASTDIDKNYIGSGTVYASGSASTDIDKNYVGSGTVYASGDAATESPDVVSYIGSGTVYATGSAIRQIDRITVGSGLVQSSGSADIQIDRLYVGSGSVYATGSAGVQVDRDYIGSGIVQASGSAIRRVDRDYIGSGTVQASGSAQVDLSFNKEYIGSGIVYASGSAAIDFYKYVGSGTVYASGSAAVEFYPSSKEVIVVESILDRYITVDSSVDRNIIADSLIDRKITVRSYL